MKDIEKARKIVTGSGAARVDIEAAISDCKAAVTSDEAALARLSEERDAAFVAGGEHLKAHKVAQADAEERLATRRALINALEKRLEIATEAERRVEVAKARGHAEGLFKEAVGAIEGYPALRKSLLAIVGKIKAADDAAVTFERRYSDERAIPRAETFARVASDLEEEIVSDEGVELWVKAHTGTVVADNEINAIKLLPGDATKGIIPNHGSHEFAGGYPVEQRKFRRQTFLPAAKAPQLEPLASGVQLPPLLPEDLRRPQVRIVPEPAGVVASIVDAVKKAVA